MLSFLTPAQQAILLNQKVNIQGVAGVRQRMIVAIIPIFANEPNLQTLRLSSLI
jgi:hypothetical protein